MPPKKINPAEGQVGFSEIAADFNVPVVIPARKSRASLPTAALDLTRRPQTWLKLLSLNEYLPVWFGKISNKADSAFYLDFFAGPGLYSSGEVTAKGSPVIACEAALAMVEGHAARGRAWTPHLRFVEPDAATRATLGAELARFDGLIDYRIIDAEAEDALPGLLAESAGTPTLAFFDPFGYGVHFDWIAAFKRAGINEVLLSFDAQAIKRNIAAGQPGGVTDFSGGDWWTAHVTGTDLDLASYLRALAVWLRRLFPYAGVQQFEFLSNHALRAIAQCCGSVVGRDEWLKAVRASRDQMTLLDNLFPELDDHELINEILRRLRPFVGVGAIFRQIIARLDDLDWHPDAVNQALAFLGEQGYVAWIDKTAAAGHPYRLFSFSGPWPAGLVWDGVKRAVPARPGRTPATTAR